MHIGFNKKWKLVIGEMTFNTTYTWNDWLNTYMNGLDAIHEANDGMLYMKWLTKNTCMNGLDAIHEMTD